MIILTARSSWELIYGKTTDQREFEGNGDYDILKKSIVGDKIDIVANPQHVP